MAVSDMEALEVLDILDAIGARPWVVGGWGVDALAERQTRTHRDLDVMVREDRLDAALAALAVHGFTVTTNWLPVRVEVDDGVRFVDLHPVRDEPDGSTTQALPDGTRAVYPIETWVGGIISGRTVVCASAPAQVRYHRGYEPRAVDRLDLAVLAEILGADPLEES